MDQFIIIVANANPFLSAIDGTSRQKIRKDVYGLQSTTNQLNLIGIYKTIVPTITGYIFFATWNVLDVCVCVCVCSGP